MVSFAAVEQNEWETFDVDFSLQIVDKSHHSFANFHHDPFETYLIYIWSQLYILHNQYFLVLSWHIKTEDNNKRHLSFIVLSAHFLNSTTKKRVVEETLFTWFIQNI